MPSLRPSLEVTAEHLVSHPSPALASDLTVPSDLFPALEPHLVFPVCTVARRPCTALLHRLTRTTDRHRTPLPRPDPILRVRTQRPSRRSRSTRRPWDRLTA